MKIITSELTIESQLSSNQFSQPIINFNNMNEEDEFYWNSLSKIVEINSTLLEAYPIYFHSKFGINNEKTEETRNFLIKLKENINDTKLNLDIFKHDELVPLKDDNILMEQFEDLIKEYVRRLNTKEDKEIIEWISNKINQKINYLKN